MGGISHLKLNIDRRPIANKYREGIKNNRDINNRAIYK